MKKLISLAAFALILTGTLAAKTPNILVEIFSLPHRPSLAVVSKLEQYLAPFTDITLHTYSFDDPKSKELVDKYNLHAHMPVAIFINGKNTFTVNGKTMTLINFPKGDSFVPSFEGSWRYQDVVSILRDMSKK